MKNVRPPEIKDVNFGIVGKIIKNVTSLKVEGEPHCFLYLHTSEAIYKWKVLGSVDDASIKRSAVGRMIIHVTEEVSQCATRRLDGEFVMSANPESTQVNIGFSEQTYE